MGAEIPDGAVLVARAILNSSLWTMRDLDRILAITCICMANWRPKAWWDRKERKQVMIARGEFITSLPHLSEASKMSIQSVRTSLQNLENIGFLTRKPTNRWTLITICKYDKYQDITKYSDQEALQINTRANRPLTGHQQATNRPLTATNNKNKGNELNKGGEEGADAPAPTPITLIDKPEIGPAEEIQRQLRYLARQAKILALNDRQLNQYLDSWTASSGASKVHEVLMDPSVRGQDVLDINRRWFRQNGEAKKIKNLFLGE